MPIHTPDFQSPPTHGQFAKAGSWETAWRFPVDEIPGEASVRAYLEDATDLAFEAFFDRAFFGLRLVGSPDQLLHFAMKGLQALQVSREQPFFDAMRRTFGLPLPGAALAFTEIGCVNAWHSIGTLRIDDPAAAAASFEDTWRAVESSALSRDERHHKAIEFAFEQPMPHWFGVPISEPGAPYRVSPALLQAALRQGRLA